MRKANWRLCGHSDIPLRLQFAIALTRAGQVLRFHDRHLVDKIDRLCSLAEEQGRVAEARAAAEAEALSSDKTSGGKRSKRPPPAESFEARQRAAIMSIDPDTAVMPTSRAAIWRAAGAACFAVDEVGGMRGPPKGCMDAKKKCD